MPRLDAVAGVEAPELEEARTYRFQIVERLRDGIQGGDRLAALCHQVVVKQRACRRIQLEELAVEEQRDRFDFMAQLVQRLSDQPALRVPHHHSYGRNPVRNSITFLRAGPTP